MFRFELKDPKGTLFYTSGQTFSVSEVNGKFVVTVYPSTTLENGVEWRVDGNKYIQAKVYQGNELVLSRDVVTILGSKLNGTFFTQPEHFPQWLNNQQIY